MTAMPPMNDQEVNLSFLSNWCAVGSSSLIEMKTIMPATKPNMIPNMTGLSALRRKKERKKEINDGKWKSVREGLTWKQ